MSQQSAKKHQNAKIAKNPFPDDVFTAPSPAQSKKNFHKVSSQQPNPYSDNLDAV
jgi:protein JBTS26